MKNKNIAAIFALFLGMLGVHRFYLGQIGLGIFYLFFLWFAWPLMFMVSMIDAIVLFSMDQKTFDRKYNRGYLREHYAHPRRARRTQNRAQRHTPKNQPQRRPSARATGSSRKFYQLRKQGLAKMNDYDYQDAIVDLQEASKLKPDDADVHFHLACLFSLTEKVDSSLNHLALAVKYGFKDKERIHNDEALAHLRIHSAFDEFVQNGYKVIRKIPVQAAEERPPKKEYSLLEQLNELAEKRKRGLLSEKEFLLEKKKLLD